jgi:hypothetical protein
MAPKETGINQVFQNCTTGYVCDRLPGYSHKPDAPSVCLQAPASVIENYIGKYCGGGYCRSRCSTPPPCPNGLRCASEDFTGDSGSTCMKHPLIPFIPNQ